MEAKLLDIELPTLGSGNNPRSDGLHLTDIIRDLMNKSGLAPEKSNWNRQAVFGAGFVWEEVIATYWEEVFSIALAQVLGRKFSWFSTGELCKDGIYCTPDGLDVGHKTWVVQEAKFTWKSSKNKPVDNWYFTTQNKAYCYVVGCVEAVIHVYYCMGDYKGSGPIYEPWYFSYKPHELQENWEMLCNHAAKMREVK